MALPPNDIIRLKTSAMTAIYIEPKLVVSNSEDVSAPKWFVYSTRKIPENGGGQ
jgi:hypothetical protein